MLEVIVSDEFAEWFEAASESEAESVSAALRLVGAAGLELAPEQSRRMLLWYDGRSGCTQPLESIWRSVEGAEMYWAWRSEVLRCLDSERFAERLAELPPEQAAKALTAVHSLQQALHGARHAIGWRASLSSTDARGSNTSLKAAFEKVMLLAGLDPAAVLAGASGLYELIVSDVSPALRILYALDLPTQRVIALVVDRLDHAFHGDAVRQAERLLADYMGERGRSASLASRSVQP